jgi:hypothetical protein
MAGSGEFSLAAATFLLWRDLASFMLCLFGRRYVFIMAGSGEFYVMLCIFTLHRRFPSGSGGSSIQRFFFDDGATASFGLGYLISRDAGHVLAAVVERVHTEDVVLVGRYSLQCPRFLVPLEFFWGLRMWLDAGFCFSLRYRTSLRAVVERVHTIGIVFCKSLRLPMGLFSRYLHGCLRASYDLEGLAASRCRIPCFRSQAVLSALSTDLFWHEGRGR